MISLKKILVFCLSVIGLVLCSCSSDADVFPVNDELPVSLSKTRSIENAVELAQKARTLVVSNQTRTNAPTIDVEDVVCIKSASTRSAAGADTLLYVVNYKDDNGFAVISANPYTKDDVLAIVENGNFPEDASADGGFGLFMDYAKHYVESAQQTRSVNAHEEGKIEVDTIITGYSPKLTVKWGFDGCEGLYAPNGNAGCDNVAMAQIMSYYQHPSSTVLIYCTPPSSLTLDWSTMVLANTKHPHTSTTCNLQIASFVRQLGLLNNSSYNSSGGTSTSLTSVHSTFSQSFQYSVSSIKSYAREDFSTAFANNKLIFMRGVSSISNGESLGHAWVVDGNLALRITTTMWRKLVSEEEWHLEDQSTTLQKYIHINWGWHGRNNGYFSINVLATKQELEYDNPYIANYYNYSFNSGLYYFEVKH